MSKTIVSRINTVLLVVVIVLLAVLLLRPRSSQAQNTVTVKVRRVTPAVSAMLPGERVVGFSCVAESGEATSPECFVASTY